MAVTIDNIRSAMDRIRDDVHMTPVLTCRALTAMTPYPQVYLKCENFQKIGAFKIRGALNAVRRAKASRPSLEDIVTDSSGNHAQAIALDFVF